ncbi:Maf family nucleotide pyrophosphatase [Guyparkeria hydrothermalis]|uniref:Maf family protein n=1 Tax=Guyparkeria hydrothermalis TaxID=923 RepID=UPI002020349D|nr:Maf family protein [Guyparkeria hydrothermalis]MCL7744548.1 Maf family nucleotide pyrophosphatase [Guyparkeria hydrothermalis]
MPHTQPSLVLASGSVTRRALLDRLRLSYRIDPADVDETILAEETPGEACLRLAKLKADTVAERHPGATVLGSDQLLAWEGGILGKPGDAATARRQLAEIAGQTIRFYVALRVVGPNGQRLDWQETVEAQMRRLTGHEIARYVEIEQPFDCAGSMRSEGLGVSLVERMDSRDPTAILGLPLIATARLLREVGIDPLAAT